MYHKARHTSPFLTLHFIILHIFTMVNLYVILCGFCDWWVYPVYCCFEIIFVLYLIYELFKLCTDRLGWFYTGWCGGSIGVKRVLIFYILNTVFNILFVEYRMIWYSFLLCIFNYPFLYVLIWTHKAKMVYDLSL